MVPKICYTKVQNVIKWINTKKLPENSLFKKTVVAVANQVVALEWFTYYRLVNDSIKLEEVAKNFEMFENAFQKL